MEWDNETIRVSAAGCGYTHSARHPKPIRPRTVSRRLRGHFIGAVAEFRRGGEHSRPSTPVAIPNNSDTGRFGSDETGTGANPVGSTSLDWDKPLLKPTVGTHVETASLVHVRTGELRRGRRVIRNPASPALQWVAGTFLSQGMVGDVSMGRFAEGSIPSPDTVSSRSSGGRLGRVLCQAAGPFCWQSESIPSIPRSPLLSILRNAEGTRFLIHAK